MPKMITIDIADDGATTVSVEADGAEPQVMNFESTDEALDALEQVLQGEADTPEAMWQQEAEARSKPTPEEMM